MGIGDGGVCRLLPSVSDLGTIYPEVHHVDLIVFSQSDTGTIQVCH